MGDELVLTDCGGSLCGYAFSREAAAQTKDEISFSVPGDGGCDIGNGSCWQAYFVEARDSRFHPKQLQDATARIKEILDPLVKGPDGRTLSFVHTPFGTLLAWIKHGQRFAGDVITSESSPEEIAEALGLVNVGCDRPATASPEQGA